MSADSREPDAKSCRRPRAQPLSPGSQRPADLLTAYFASAIVFLVAGAVTAALNGLGELPWYGRWLALHLILLGGVSQLVLGAGQFFTTAFLATDPPSRRVVRVQIGVWVSGTLLLSVAVPAGWTVAADVAGAMIACGLVLFGVTLRRLERGSLQTARWAVRWYYACAMALVLGALIGMLIARGTAWSHGSLLEAHLALNLAGWLGTAIVGTLHTFFPSLTQSTLRHPRLQGPTFYAWTAGVAALAAGGAFELVAVTVAGWLLLTLAAALLAANLLASARAAEGPLGLAPRLVGLAQLFLVGGLLVALAMLVAEGPEATPSGAWRSVLATLLMAGWIGLTVAGSMLHLLSVLHRVRGLAGTMPAPRPARDRLQSAALAAAVAIFALTRISDLSGIRTAATMILLAAAAPVAWRILSLAAGATLLATRKPAS